jgi:hypothetical protein
MHVNRASKVTKLIHMWVWTVALDCFETGSCYVAQTWPQIHDSPTSASQVPGLQVHTTMPSAT